jgi:hypothetical protein
MIPQSLMFRRSLMLAVSSVALFALAGPVMAEAPAQPSLDREGGRSASVRAAPKNSEKAKLGSSHANGDCAATVAAPSEPFAFTVDGKSVDGANGRAPADSQRCTDLALARADVQIRYDGLNSEPRLNVVASPDAALKGARVTFQTYANYALWIKKAEIRIFEKGSTTRQTPIAVIPIHRGAAEWQAPREAGDLVTYVLRVYDANGRFDETSAKVLDLAQVRGGTARADDLMAVYNGNALEVRNIPVNGGAVLVSGRGVPPGHSVTVMGIPVPVDAKGDFAVRQIVSSGEHQIDVALADKKGVASVFSRSAIVPDHDFFYVALADLTVGKNATTGPMALLNPDRADEFKDKVFVNGRLAFYLKGKVQGDTLLTASADTREQPIQHMFSNFDSKDPRYLLRNLDPNRYYPIYGDDSTLVEDAPTRGKFYVRLERGDNNIVWGNFKTTITGTEFVRYERGLYGARAQAKTEATTKYGERRAQAEVFAAEPGTLGARDVFRGTGGTLYYMSRQNMTQGSERVTVEQRDSSTGLVLKSRVLAATQDYDVNYLQGRVMLKSPLASTGGSDFIVQAGSLNGVEQYVVVTYEYAPGLQASRDKAVGGRASAWVTDHVEIGVTGYNQTSSAEKLGIGGADMTVRLMPGSYVKFEAARSSGPGSGEQVSLDGGFTFSSRATSGAPAWAKRVETAADLAEIIKGSEGRLAAYWKEKDANYSGPGELTLSRGGREMGVKSIVKLDQNWSSKTKVDGKQDEFRTYSSAEQNVAYSFNEYWKATVGARFDNNRVAALSASPILNQQGRRTDAAVRLDYDSQKDWGTYVYGQVTVDKSGERDANNRLGFGANLRFNETTKGTAELSHGNGGIGGKVGVEHKVDEKRSSYLNYGLDPDRTDIISRGGTGIMTSGSRERFSDTFSVFGEERLRHGGGYSGLTHAFGLDFVPVEHWKAGIVLETGKLSDPYQGDVKRTAISPSIGYTHGGLTYAGRYEYRHDDITTVTTNSVRDTYLTNNTLVNKLNADWRYIGKLNGSYSTTNQAEFYRGNYLEAVTGFAYRPVNNDRLNALFKYTYFYDLPSPGQRAGVAGVGDYSQKSHVLSMDAAYDLTTFVTIGGKYALRSGAIKDNVLGGPWLDSTTQLLIGRLDLHVVKEWDVVVEARQLDVFAAKDRQAGALVGVYRHLGDNFKVGVGYNFTKFTDDLTNLSSNNKGVFVNAIGKF